jgi:hypothetical protein
MVPVVTIWLSLYGAAVLYAKQAALPSAVLVVLAIVIAAGLPPGSYLRSPLDRLAMAAARGKSGIVVLLAVLSPSLLLAFAGLLAYSNWNYRQFALRYGLESSVQALALPLSLIAAAVGLVILIANLAALMRRRQVAR